MAPCNTFIARLLALVAALSLCAQPAAAQGFSVLRDAETEALLQDMVDPLAEAAGLGEGAVDVVLLNDNSINAFVAGGQRIYVHSGLINAADSANEVQGVLAHELGHITGGHINRFSEGAGNASRITLLSTLLAVGAALAGGGEAAMGVLAAGQQAAMGSFLAFSRTQEASADAASVDYLQCAGIDGAGLISFFRKLQNYEFRRNISQDQEREYSRTHPLSGNRIARLEDELAQRERGDRPPADLTAAIEEPAVPGAEVVERMPVDCRTTPRDTADLEERFQRAKAKLYGYLAPPERALNAYPEYMTGAPARYARAYAYHEQARVDKALEEVNALIAMDPDDPYFLELKGQILLESGHVNEALPPLREATRLTGSNPLIASILGHALIATEDSDNFDEAEQVLRSAVGRDRENPFAWYQLGVVYGQRGDIPRARLASAEQQIMQGNFQGALVNAQAAENGLETGSPDWIRAQDVALQARGLLERQRDRN
ncbi:M48 family metalloprotease [Aurantiacibacter poecillastricola]|uniref:M48 family metalloprotease n=1 Tax=Aurantiacibacter poecillastricola TaxID=3064385 RepID=UPI00273DBAED|nr:M48 family metalloprotease [Aurantiacibacter sp. 219JJ12-13]MDP5260575.1 M48 family metalloprotease [Aurantiacibacter sp. 219JJ12-13]